MIVTVCTPDNGRPRSVLLEDGDYTGAALIAAASLDVKYGTFEYDGDTFNRAEFSAKTLRDRSAVVATAGKITNG